MLPALPCTEPRPHLRGPTQPPDGEDGSGATSWQRRSAWSPADVPGILDAVAAALVAAGYAEGNVFGMRLAVDEALANALKHGHRGDPTRRVEVRYLVTAAEALVQVEDSGEGFDPAAVPDPRAPENLERPGGRGLLLMRACVSWVRHNERGNVVTLCRRR
jgi:serine/threonine-protein kinase RsbW